MENLKTVKENLIIQFCELRNNIFEIESQNIDDEYYTYNIQIDTKGFYTIPYSNKSIRINYDKYFDNIDYYLEELYELCLNDILEYENNLNK